MVASSGADHYPPLQLSTTMAEGRPQSNGNDSTIHSPVYDTDSFQRPDQFRYSDQFDIRPQTGGDLATQFSVSDYSSSLIPPPQHPLTHPTLQVPRPNAFNPPEYNLLPRNQSDFFPNATATTTPQHLPPSPTFYFSREVEHPLPGRPLPHDPTYYRLRNAPMVASIPSENAPSVPPSAPSLESSTLHPNRRDRKEISSVVIACRQCRSRKIRCDSTRPMCSNCVRRSNACEYDAVPKRRGPDKRPGTRQRSCKKRPATDSTVSNATQPPAKRKKIDSLSVTLPSQTPSKENMAENEPTRRRSQEFSQASCLHALAQVGSFPIKEESQSPVTQRYPNTYTYDNLKTAFPRPIDTNVMQLDKAHNKFPPPTSPVVESIHREWWDLFLDNSGYSLPDIENHIRYLFSDTAHTIEFLNVDYFVRTLLYRPDRRYTIQPAFILAALAMSTLMKSSSIENGDSGRRSALGLRNAAHQAIQTAIRYHSVDAAVAEAALILCLFESSAHPDYDPGRHASTLVLLSDIIQSLSLTTIDRSDPEACQFPEHAVPTVQLSTTQALSRRCGCIPSDAQEPPDDRTSWSYPLPWDPSWSEIQIRDEECRRVCWCALSLTASYTVQAAVLDDDYDGEGVKEAELWICDPANWALLFPGEVLDRDSPSYRNANSPSPKESVFALYCRSMLLWVFCHYRLARCTDQELQAEYAQEALGESKFLQESLDFHICNLDTGLIYLTREYIYNTRVAVARCLRSFHGLPTNRLFTKRQAQDWVTSQEQVVKRVSLSVQRITDPHGLQLTRRPYQVPWYSHQLAICLMLWKHDNSNIPALHLAKSLLVIVDILNYLWPCSRQQAICADLRNKLMKACRTVGLDPPLAAEYSVPPILRS
ncbi:hypothetical protein E1B28_010654 [Marasmius oreades]|uniref:Zn(2)-C6 fungal-type domain-containing protein n=1 Tax=Marasmius oreades TaxID=181124 RepID=A0A9P7RZ27_9AGAR|nr:uncharacterized protein E1B28_010654 [Marasmius oreades]KAG7091633.1 hypothetical protein E1B28_010654 [Marasmius oreades]